MSRMHTSASFYVYPSKTCMRSEKYMILSTQFHQSCTYIHVCMYIYIHQRFRCQTCKRFLRIANTPKSMISLCTFDIKVIDSAGLETCNKLLACALSQAKCLKVSFGESTSGRFTKIKFYHLMATFCEIA